MNFCDFTLPSPEENLACDEALLDSAEEGRGGEVLRVWEPRHYFVVLGYSNKAAMEVNVPYCRLHTIPVLRRCTGGGAVLQGPGCLNYSLVLHLREAGPLQSIPTANAFVLKRHQEALATLLRAPVEMRGHTDLAIGGLKFSGNSQRRRRQYLLFHGSFLLHLDVSMVEGTLRAPSRQPEYRLNRSHSDFLLNLGVPALRIKQALVKCWTASEPLDDLPFERVSDLTREKYGCEEWNSRW